MKNKEKRFDVWELVRAFEARYPENVEADETGYKIFERYPKYTIGWYCCGGSIGHLVCSWSEPKGSEDYPVARKLLAWLRGETKEFPAEVEVLSEYTLK